MCSCKACEAKNHVRFTRIRDVKAPERAHVDDAGIDFFIPNDFAAATLPPQCAALIPSGIKVSIPTGHALIAMNKSGVATKMGLDIGACVVDENYQGEVHVHLFNTTNSAITLQPGMKIAQFLLMPVNYAMPLEVENEEDLYITQSIRGAGGFGSTGG